MAYYYHTPNICTEYKSFKTIQKSLLSNFMRYVISNTSCTKIFYDLLLSHLEYMYRI